MEYLENSLSNLENFDSQEINIDNMNDIFNLLAKINNTVQEKIMECGDKIDKDEINKPVKFDNDEEQKNINLMKDMIFEKEEDKKKKKEETLTKRTTKKSIKKDDDDENNEEKPIKKTTTTRRRTTKK